MFCFHSWFSLLLLVLAVGSPEGNDYRLQAAVGAGAPPPQEKATADQFYLKIEPLIDNVDDVDVRRFIITTKGARMVRFALEADRVSVKPQSVQHDPNDDQHTFEVILLLRLQEERGPNNPNIAVGKLWRLIKFSRERWGWIKTELIAPPDASLRELIKITAESGSYALGKRHVLGQFHGADIVVSVE
jgi:hypothetical protein